MTLQRTCAVCGTVFATVRSHGRYCSAACKRIVLLRNRHEAGRLRRHRRCPRCGMAFVARRADAIFCSGGCKQAAYRQRHKAELL